MFINAGRFSKNASMDTSAEKRRQSANSSTSLEENPLARTCSRVALVVRKFLTTSFKSFFPTGKSKSTLAPAPSTKTVGVVIIEFSPSEDIQYPVHRRMLPVLHLDPMFRPPGLIGPVPPLRHQALQPHAAGRAKQVWANLTGFELRNKDAVRPPC